MRRWWVGLAVIGVVAAVAVWRLWRTGEDPTGEVRVASAPDSTPAVATLSGAKTKTAAEKPDAGSTAPARSKNTVATFGWGSGEDQLGRDRPQEGNPEAPMSLTVDSKGNTWVLDQVNKRLVRVDRQGRRLSPIAVPVQAAQDVVVAPDGTTAVIDRLVDKSVAIIAPDGTLVGELPLVGKGMPEGGAATGVFLDGDSVVVERAHGDSVKLGSLRGVKDPERPQLPGRPTRDAQSYLTASIGKARAGTVLLTAIDSSTRAHRFTREYSLQRPVRALMLLDGDRHGVLYLGALVTDPEVVTVLCLDGRDGHPLGQLQVPANVSADETFRELAISDDGEIYALMRSEEGAELRRFTCP